METDTKTRNAKAIQLETESKTKNAKAIQLETESKTRNAAENCAAKAETKVLKKTSKFNFFEKNIFYSTFSTNLKLLISYASYYYSLY